MQQRIEMCGRVVTYRDDAVPDMFVRTEPVPGGATAVYVSSRTWRVLLADPAAKVLYLHQVPGRSGGWALAGPVFDRAATRAGVRRSLRLAASA